MPKFARDVELAKSHYMHAIATTTIDNITIATAAYAVATSTNS